VAAALATSAVAWAEEPVSVEARASLTVIDPPGLGEAAAFSVAPVRRPTGAGVTAQGVDGRYEVSGVAGDSYSISVPSTLTLVRAGGAEEVQLQLTPEGVVSVLPGAYGARASGSVAVQGAVGVQAGAPPGVYQGSLPVILSLQ